MANIPTLTDEQFQMLVHRAVNDPLAEFVGFQPPHSTDPFCRFSKHAEGPFLGHHSVGDGVSRAYLQEAVNTVLESRGNYLQTRIVASAYRDMVGKTPEQWQSSTALVLCMLAPLLGVLAEQRTRYNH